MLRFLTAFLWLLSSTTLLIRIASALEPKKEHAIAEEAETGQPSGDLDPESDELEEASGEPVCPDLDDDNGRWEGSRSVGGKYTLTCAPGFKVQGRGDAARTLTCPQSLKWDEDVWCENIDDCAKLKHGCGALGVCIDLVNSYECNCEQGYGKRHSQDGEIVCGDKHWNSVVCGGHTCGSYGVCIDLTGASDSFDTEHKTKEKLKYEEQMQERGHNEKNESKPGEHEDEPNLDDDQDKAEGEERHHDHEDHERHLEHKEGKVHKKHHHKATYRCECTDGFEDDGRTCVRLNCGSLDDNMGTWNGSTEYGGEYSLRCPDQSFVWGGALKEVTISCPKKGVWLSKPACVSPIREALDAQVATLRFWTFVFLALVCVCSAAAAAGLTLGVATLEPFKLNVICETRTEECFREEEREKLREDKAYAQQMRAVVRGDHRLMVTLFIFNTIANEALPIFLDQVASAIVAVMLSVSVVLIFGEILPSAVCTGPNQFKIAAKSVPFVRALEFAFGAVAKPIGVLLDRALGMPDSFSKYRRQELRALFQLHCQQENGDEDGPTSPGGGHSTSRTAMSRQGSERSNEEADKNRRALPVLSTSELRIFDNLWDLNSTHLQRPMPRNSGGGRRMIGSHYRGLNECLKVQAQASSIDALAQNLPFKFRPCAVLVLNDEISRSDGPTAPPILADSVQGILHPRELLAGGRELLHKLCVGQPAIVDEQSSVLEVLRSLGTSAFGIVVRRADSKGRREVKGVVCRSEVLANLVSNSNDALFASSASLLSDDAEGDISTPLGRSRGLLTRNLSCTRGARLARSTSLQVTRSRSNSVGGHQRMENIPFPERSTSSPIQRHGRQDASREGYLTVATHSESDNWRPAEPIV